MFGLFPADSEEMTHAAETIKQTFELDDHTIGLPRYEYDEYYRVDPATRGNWWCITTLWMAQYYTEVGKSDKTKQILEWITERMGSTGILPEQLNPHDGSFVGVAPLTWSHAEYVATLLDGIAERSDA